MQLQSKHDAATSFVDAGNAYKKADPQGEATWQRLCCSCPDLDRVSFVSGPRGSFGALVEEHVGDETTEGNGCVQWFVPSCVCAVLLPRKGDWCLLLHTL